MLTKQLRDWFYKYSSQERFRADLAYLRSEGLISFVYDDIDTIKTTKSGQDVIKALASDQAPPPMSTSVAPTRTLSASTRRTSLADTYYTVPRDSASQVLQLATDVSSAIRDVNRPSTPAAVAVAIDGTWTKFRIEAAGRYQIDVEGEARTNFDPVILLFREGLLDTAIAEDDDGGSALNSRIETILEPGFYLLFINSADRERGRVTVSITKRDPN